jgi:DNA-binding IclR family transcriptional regulator
MKSVREPRVLDILSRKDMSTSEICVLVHCTQRSAQEMLANMRRKGLIYRSGWRRQPDGIAALFRAGIGVDAPKPLSATGAERVRRMRAKETQEDKEFRQAREKAKSIKPRRDPMIAAFFGEYK